MEGHRDRDRPVRRSGRAGKSVAFLNISSHLQTIAPNGAARLVGWTPVWLGRSFRGLPLQYAQLQLLSHDPPVPVRLTKGVYFAYGRGADRIQISEAKAREPIYSPQPGGTPARGTALVRRTPVTGRSGQARLPGAGPRGRCVGHGRGLEPGGVPLRRRGTGAREGRSVKGGLVVLLAAVLAVGACGTTAKPKPKTARRASIPDVRGLEAPNAAVRLLRAHLLVRLEVAKVFPTQARAQVPVVRQSPAAGARRRAWAMVTLTIGLPPETPKAVYGIDIAGAGRRRAHRSRRRTDA